MERNNINIKKKSILIVEDSLIQAEFLKRALVKHGYGVRSAKNGIQGLSMIEKAKPDLVISDISMPEMNGYELCSSIKNSMEFRSIPIMLLTELNNPKEILRGLESGADNYITKPYKEEHLLSKVESLLSYNSENGLVESSEELNLTYDGEHYAIRSSRKQMLDLLLTTYENAVRHNHDMKGAQLELRKLNEELEEKIWIRTKELEHRVKLERFIATVSTKFINLLPEEIDIEINTALKMSCQLIEADRGFIIQKDSDTYRVSFFYISTIDSQHATKGEEELFKESDYPWCMERLRQGESVYIADIDQLSENVVTDRETLKKANIKSLIIVPMFYSGLFGGFVKFDLSGNFRKFFYEDIMLLRMLGEVYAGTLERKRIGEIQSKMLNDLEKSNQEQSSLIYILSHDLRSPLRAIGSLTDIISADYGEVMDDEGREHLSLLMGRIKRMYVLLDAILLYSKVGRNMEHDVEVDLNTLLEETISELNPPDHISIKAENMLPSITCNRAGIKQLFLNLIGNSIKYMDKQKGEITVGSIDQNGVYRLHVTDNGPGIEEVHFEKIFKIFQTLNPRDEMEGAGIGLPMARKIVETHGGAIWLSSKPGEGTTFFLTLPKIKK